MTRPDLHDPLTGQSITFVEVAEDTGGLASSEQPTPD